MDMLHPEPRIRSPVIFRMCQSTPFLPVEGEVGAVEAKAKAEEAAPVSVTAAAQDRVRAKVTAQKMAPAPESAPRTVPATVRDPARVPRMVQAKDQERAPAEATSRVLTTDVLVPMLRVGTDKGRSSDYKLRFGFSFDRVSACHEKPA